MRLHIIHKSMLCNIIFIGVLFIIIFGANFRIPGWNTLIIGGIVGIIVMIKSHPGSQFKLAFPRSIVNSFWILLGLCIWVIISTVYNQVLDIHIFLELIILNIIRFFNAYLIVYLFRWAYDEKATFKTLYTIILCLILCQEVVAIISFINPSIYSIITIPFKVSGLLEAAGEYYIGFRPVGIGGYAFFGAALLNCYALIIYSYIVSHCKVSTRQVLLYGIVAFLGIFIARTTFVGIAISMIILFLGNNGRKVIKKILVGVVVSIMIIMIVPMPSFISEKIDIMNKFGFELFYSYIDSGAMETKSTDKMMTMYRLPDATDTWVFGDARLRDGSGYYQHTDIGFIRLIYCGGVVSLLLFLLYQIKIIKNATKFRRDGKYLAFALIALLVILNFKGLTDLSLYLFLLYEAEKRLKFNVRSKYTNSEKLSLRER